MAKKRTETVLVELRTIGNDMDDESDSWEESLADNVACWQEIAEVLRTRRYLSPGYDVQLSVDWSPVVRCYRRYQRAQRAIRLGPRPPPDNIWRLFPKRALLKFEVAGTGDRDSFKYEWFLPFFVEYFLHDVFLIANIARPGSANFFGCRLKRGKPWDENIGLSSFRFAYWWSERDSWSVPKYSTLPIGQVANWYFEIRPEVRLVGVTPLERALLSMLQMCRLDDPLEPLIWCFHALEAICDTRIGESFSGIASRLGLLLELDPRSTTTLRKRLRTTYDLRSAFVHGRMQTLHPLDYEGIDKRIHDVRMKAYRESWFGFALVAAAVQSIARRGWTSVAFPESLEGMMMDSASLPHNVVPLRPEKR